MKNIIALIPARMASTRYPGKPIVDICGLPMIEHVWRRVKMNKKVSDLYIVTCDREIKEVAERFGAEVIMTSPHHPRGTDRVAEGCLKLIEKSELFDIAINIQGDEPLLDPKTIDLLVDPFLKDERVQVVNLMEKLDDENEVKSPNNVKVVFDLAGNALYYSRLAVPNGQASRHYKQLGLYAFSREAIVKFAKLKETPLEIAESDDMLRFVENGINVKMVLSPLITEGVDTPADHVMVAELMAKDELFKKYRDK